jgi:hypothetical protein
MQDKVDIQITRPQQLSAFNQQTHPEGCLFPEYACEVYSVLTKFCALFLTLFSLSHPVFLLELPEPSDKATV